MPDSKKDRKRKFKETKKAIEKVNRYVIRETSSVQQKLPYLVYDEQLKSYVLESFTNDS